MRSSYMKEMRRRSGEGNEKLERMNWGNKKGMKGATRRD